MIQCKASTGKIVGPHYNPLLSITSLRLERLSPLASVSLWIAYYIIQLQFTFSAPSWLVTCWSTSAISAIGPAAQYKNFKNFKNLCKNHDDIGISAEWNFFVSSHGKSPCGGIGGTTKQLAARANLQRSTSDKILTPSDLFRFCGKQLHGIKFLFITKQEIEAGKKIWKWFHSSRGKRKSLLQINYRKETKNKK